MLGRSLMDLRFANSYVDRLFAERDLLGIYHLVRAVAEERLLVEEYWLFSRLLEWEGSTRSGIWQYYEHIAEDTFQRVGRDLDQFGLSELAEQYRFGQRVWRVPEQVALLDRWIDAHAREIYVAAFHLIASHRPSLYASS